MDLAWIEEELCLLSGVDQGPRCIEVALVGKERVGIHPVHLDRDACGPFGAEFGDREAGIEEQRSPGARPRLGELLGGMTPIEKPE